MTPTSTISERLANVLRQISEAATHSARTPEDITLIVVSKTHPPEALTEVLSAGHAIFGESRVQEARAKIPLVSSRAHWHFIGHLQKNKIRHALPHFEMIHSVDSLELATEIHRIAAEIGLSPNVLLEINVVGEGSKFGFKPEELPRQMEALLSLDRLNITGLMCIPPPQPRAELSRPHFASLRECRERLQAEFQVRLPHLSMGMSADFAAAISEGATHVRVGTAIFGKRAGRGWKPGAEGMDD